MTLPSALPTWLILASRSPRRTELLRAAGYDHQIWSAPCDETFMPPETPLAYVERVAGDKAQACAARWLSQPSPRSTCGLILAADTTVWDDGHAEPFGKPYDRTQAANFLRHLSARGMHYVSTAFAVMRVESDPHGAMRGECVHRQCVTTKVWMRPLTEAELQHHLDRGEWTDKAGGYAIQGAAAGLVTRIDGSYTAVVGLPLAEVAVALQRLGLPLGGLA